MFGWPSSIARIVAGTELCARLCAPGRAPSVSTRSFAGPSRCRTLLRLRNTGTERSETSASSTRNGVRSGVASPVTSISGSRSSSAARRLTKVVFAWRRAGGSATSERSKASFSAAIAPSAWFAFEVSAARSSRRSAIAPSTLEPEARNSEKVCSSRVSSSSSRVVDWMPGARYL